MKQKVKSAPKELVRRGLGDGTERLRGQLRDTAQRGQADDYGGDRIEDAAAAGARQAGRGVEALLKKRKNGKGRTSCEEPHTVADSYTDQEPSAQPPPQDSPRIKTREPVAAGDSGTVPSGEGRVRPTPAVGTERQRIKIWESTVRDTRADTPPTPQDETPLSQIKTWEAAAYDPPADGEPTVQPGPERQRIKMRESVVRDTNVGTPPTPQNETPPPRIRTRESAVHDSFAGGEAATQLKPERQWIKMRKSIVRDAHVDPPPTPQDETPPLRIKARKSVVRDTCVDPPLSPRDEAQPPQIRMRESATYDIPAGGEPMAQPGLEPQAALEPPQIKTRGTVASDSPDHAASVTSPSGKRPPDRLSIKTKDAYIQWQATMDSDQPSQAFVQGRVDFMREQSRRAVAKWKEAQRTGDDSVSQVKGGTDMASSAAPPVSEWRGYAPTSSTHKSVGPKSSDIQPVGERGRTIIKTSQSVSKAPERTVHHAAKTAERASGKTIKTARRTAKTAARTAKAAGQSAKTARQTAQATAKATQRTIQAAHATAKATAITAKAAVKATAAAIKAAIAALQSLAAAIAAGGWVAVVIIIVICMVGLLIASPFGIFFSGGGSSTGASSSSTAMAQINQEYADTLSGLQAGGSYDSVEIIGQPPSWADVFAVFYAKISAGDDAAVLDADRMELLRTAFWDMTKITSETKTVDHPATSDTDAWTETVLVITVIPRTPDDMRVFYAFTDAQNAALDEALTGDSHGLWSDLLYGGSGEIVTVALSQVGNVGGQPYWSWYGFDSRVEWCACFVSWCANECGYIDAGIIPKFASCSVGSNWFKNRGQWQDNSYEPRPGDIIFFDWDNKGSSGPRDNVPDHVGIVERVENGTVYTVEGNSGNRCRQRSYSVGYYEIWGYGTLIR